MILRHSQQITGQLEQDYYSLEDLLGEIAREKGLRYRVKEWKTAYEVLPLEDGQRLEFSNFVGYKMVHGLFLPKTVLLATIEKPDVYKISEQAENYVVSLSYHPWHFAPWTLQQRVQERFPHRQVELREY